MNQDSVAVENLERFRASARVGAVPNFKLQLKTRISIPVWPTDRLMSGLMITDTVEVHRLTVVLHLCDAVARFGECLETMK
jgi:hypothetical protein